MRIPRIYHSTPLSDHSEIVLNDDAAKHVSLVLRMKKGQWLHLFDGSNRLFTAEIIRLDKKRYLFEWMQVVWKIVNRLYIYI
ncbi:hypothetical protein Rin_00003840 [Candidatus Regiella insecticola 5.15]|uniref:Ribosomal RNA small subunit methyltransferase E n=1 Tax=Candidatus Regiella insecticola 5.15 TaxID=1005043 RepID=G2GX95_9ENTR|nr:hypothetical protein Rin_00003840 [Candidatus Regiella insecticola 5.15]